ncbi:type II toxin-antitoxin system RelE/ParE family toxin [Geotalea uraniireducens]|uniref:Addiction module toxin, RelE/StbE family n=1 Tax=Geotalea uraniireducens (strain Rf4) TaxID=351605 RepID=A5G6E2_GEOUR|nr:type II toxin-antitoxin system RelE/ParE family toxin [Geotalea uraniireducens]ABQ27360.1 addiction module toxin, RelE/StbE family [Geotalea uraniireducens Rf4]
MAHSVRWSPQALADVEAIAEYIERDSPFYAKAVVTKIIGVTRQLSEFPLSGRVVPEMKDDAFREHFVFSYRVIYRIEGELITVAAVVHGKRLLRSE